MNAKERRSLIISKLKESENPVSASALAKQLSVSRQVIVGDVALLRASGMKISATPRGYILESDGSSGFPYIGLLTCNHTPEQTRDELYAIVDFGGYVIDVIVEHPIYGQLTGPLDIASRHDVDIFIQHLAAHKTARPLSVVTGGVHFHRIGCKSEENFELIKNALKGKDILHTY